MNDPPPWGDHDVTAHVIRHVSAWWPDRELRPWRWELGSFPDEWPDFRVLCAEPVHDGEAWVYVSAGAWEADDHSDGAAHEFIISSPVEEVLHVEKLAAIVTRQADPDVVKLREGALLPLGEPWLDGAAEDHFLMAEPPPEWPAHLEVGDLLVHFLLAVPTTGEAARAPGV